jgi:hypothetical protein
MQVLVIAVQNAVAYEDLGAATSGATFFRSMRGSFGTAVFGAIFANLLTGNLKHYLAGAKLPSSLTGASVSPAALAKLPAAAHGGYVQAYAHSLQTVFLVAVPIAAVAFALTWLLPELKLRKTAKAVDPGAFVMPTDRSSVQEMERALTVLARRENRGEALGRLAARGGLEIEPAVYRRVRFAPMRPQTVLQVIPGYHPIYRDAPAELLAMVDDRYAHGCFREWASFTHSALALCREQSASALTGPVARAVLELHAGGKIDEAA